mgnify:FL=1
MNKINCCCHYFSTFLEICGNLIILFLGIGAIILFNIIIVNILEINLGNNTCTFIIFTMTCLESVCFIRILYFHNTINEERRPYEILENQ